ncbi:MAG TPA: right-handed parallel beta-helix repeat-containing protein, partial [Verrucomicrobiae bacterium]|nr:right-handed parallel beta-helix repeat-containing protein [Verrucomicrobiae bacterium]
MLQNCVIEYGASAGFADQGIVIQNGSPALLNCTVRGSRKDGLILFASDARVEGCQFTGNGGFALSMRSDSLPKLRNNTATGNGDNAIGVFGSSFSRTGAWTRDTIPYTIVEDLYISSGQTLTLEPGTTVQFQGPEDGMFIDGSLLAQGTEGAPILFTSDDTVKTPGQWKALIFRAANTNSILSHCIVEYGAAQGFYDESVRLENASPLIANCTIRNARLHGLNMYNADPQVRDCSFAGNGVTNGGFALVMRSDSLPALRNNSATGNGNNAIGVYGSSFSRSGKWTKDALPYTIVEDLYVNSGRTLTLEPGATIQFQGVEDGMFIDGTLLAEGTADAPILFTSDDAAKAPGQWTALIFRAENTNSILSHCIVEYGAARGYYDESVRLENASPAILETAIRNSRVHGLNLYNCNARVENCTFTGNGGTNGGFAMVMRADALPILRNNSASANGNDAIGVYGTSFTRSGAWTKDALPYTIVEDLYVNSGKTLTLEPGITIQFQGVEDGMYIDGTLLAQGTPGAPIVFTSDDTAKAPGQWKALIFRAPDTNSVLSNCIVEYGAAQGYYDESVRLENSSPSILNATIRNARLHGLNMYNSDARVENCVFAGNGATNGGFAVVMRADALPVLRNNAATGNGNNGVGVYGTSFTRSGTWTRDTVPYTIIEDLYVNTGKTLTLEPGTTVQFQGLEDALIVDGILLARGTPAAPIRFTSDDAVKAPGQWEAIYFRAANGDSVLENCIVEFAGAGTDGGIVSMGGSPRISAVIVQNSAHDGLRINGGGPQITSSKFANNSNDGVAVINGAQPVIRQSTFVGNTNFALENFDTRVVVDAKNNFWGDASGPFDNSNIDSRNQLNPNGKGGKVSEYVDWSGFTGSDAVFTNTPSAPFLVFGPASLDFGSVTVGGARDLPLAVTNTGSATLVIGSLSSDNNRFGATAAFPVTLAAGTATNITVRFAPTGVGAQTGTLSFSTNEQTDRPTQTVSVTGQGVAVTAPPVITSLDPASGPPGSIVVIRGTGFNPAPSGSQVEVNGSATVVLDGDASKLVALLPGGLAAGSAEIKVRVDTTASAPATFTVTMITTANVSLTATRAGGNVNLSWVDGAGSFQLESTPELASPIAWTLVTDTPVATGNLRTVSIAPVGRMFYRLRSGVSTGATGGAVVPAAAGGIIQVSPEVSLAIPPGALDQDTRVQVTLVKDASNSNFSFSSQFVFQPDGLVFKQPATLSFQLPPGVANSPGFQIHYLSALNEGRRSGAETNYTDLVTNYVYDAASGILRVPVSHFSSMNFFVERFETEVVFDIPGKYLKKGDLIYAMTRDNLIKQMGWLPGHTGIYLGTTSASSTNNDGMTIIESTSADTTPEKKFGGAVDGVQFQHDFNLDSSFFKRMGAGLHLYMGARRPKPEPTDDQRTAIAQYAIGKIGTPYLTVGGTGFFTSRFGLSCVGLTESAYESAGINIVPGLLEIPLTPLNQFARVEPVSEVEMEVGDSYVMSVYGVRASGVGNYEMTAFPAYDITMTTAADSPAEKVVAAGRVKFFNGNFTFRPVEDDADLSHVFRFHLKKQGAGEDLRSPSFL